MRLALVVLTAVLTHVTAFLAGLAIAPGGLHALTAAIASLGTAIAAAMTATLGLALVALVIAFWPEDEGGHHHHG